MGSGLNGQNFTFNGYLPINSNERSRKIKELENISKKNNQTQIFIETPYRNNQLVDELLKSCLPNTLLCIGKEITSIDEEIITRPISEWKQNKPNLHKKTAIFLILGISKYNPFD